ncbi:MAG TPA: membrane protein insertase YidC [Saprospiraceae bacterium]|nr:membrane protein insertase YidC [Saprospiraceae bacterium]
MDRNNIIGIVLIFLILVVWQWMVAPTPEQIEAQKRTQDSVLLAKKYSDSLANIQNSASSENAGFSVNTPAQNDSVQLAVLSKKYGAFAPAAIGTEETSSLENEFVKVTFTNKGGKVKEVLVKNYFKIKTDSNGTEHKIPLKLLEDVKNRFEYLLPVKGTPQSQISSEDLFFQKEISGNTITFRASAGEGQFFEQRYTLSDDSYTIDYQLKINGLDNILSEKNIRLNWLDYLDHLEKNASYERNYSSVYYKVLEENPDHCSCTSDDSEDLQKKVKWVSHSNQFFNTSLLAENAFVAANLEVAMLPAENEDLKKLHSQITIPFGESADGSFKMKIYSGPNEFERLHQLGSDMEDIVPFGWSIFGTINRWVIRPLFSFLSGFIGSKGLIILVLTLIVKALLYPLNYKMIHSQTKMTVLKPEIARLKEKHKDDQQQQQLETMKIYREYGVNPLGGCLPVVLQMPIWFALYRFFPASIEFRQESFLWASDLSSYDEWIRLSFNIPFYGEHVSLFTLIWVVTTILYTWYNSKFMDLSANPMMIYMQYAMPVMFIFFFNSFASGLTAYLCFSNILNVGQMVVTKNYIIDHEKIRAGLELNKLKPKKKGGFQERLESALKEQQKIQQDRQKGGNKQNKK